MVFYFTAIFDGNYKFLPSIDLEKFYGQLIKFFEMDGVSGTPETPLKPPLHPNKKLTSFFTMGISYGFQIGYSPQKSLKSAKHNLGCALDHPEVVDQYMNEELAQNLVVGPFHTSWALHMHIS